MENSTLNKIWDSQDNTEIIHPEIIIKKAKKQRRRQYGSILIMGLTVATLIGFIGTLIILKPGFQEISFGHAEILLSSLYLLSLKRIIGIFLKYDL